MTQAALGQLVRRIEKNQYEGDLPPVAQWQPAQQIDLPLSIDRQGQWCFAQEPIQRTRLARLLSTLLRREPDGRYAIITPQEKVYVEVDDVPFIICLAEREVVNNKTRIWLTTQFSDRFYLGAENPITFKTLEQAAPVPYVRVRGQLFGRILPAVFYQLVEWGEGVTCAASGKTDWRVSSDGQFFSLGQFEA